MIFLNLFYLTKNSALYAIVELNEKDFGRMFDRTLYDKVKAKWDPENKLLNCYAKCKKNK